MRTQVSIPQSSTTSWIRNEEGMKTVIMITDITKALDEYETVVENLADYASKFYHAHDMYFRAWLREMGGVIVPKSHTIDGFVLRMRGIYGKAQLVDRIKKILVDELKAKHTSEEMFDAVFKYLAENTERYDQVPTN